MNRHIRAAAVAFGAILISASAAYAAPAGPSAETDPGFVPQTGQINPGQAPAPWSATRALPQDQQPDQDKARAALMAPDPVGVASLGEGAAPQQSGGGQITTGAVAEGGSAPSGTIGATAQEPSAPSGPIGSTVQTMPAKYSQRNDLLDHLPIMAWPLMLSQQQLQEVYRSVMAQQAQPIEGIDKLKPAASLSFEQANRLQPLPPDVAGIDGLQGLKYVRSKSSVLLVRPSTRIVVDEIKM